MGHFCTNLVCGLIGLLAKDLLYIELAAYIQKSPSPRLRGDKGGNTKNAHPP